jgi:hypothetical protein
MELIDRVAAVSKHQREPGLDELVPHGRFARTQVVGQKSREQILTRDQVRNVSFPHRSNDLVGILSSGYGSE